MDSNVQSRALHDFIIRPRRATDQRPPPGDHHRHISEDHVHPGDDEHEQSPGQHKQSARHHPAPGAVQQSAGVDGQLLGFRSGKEHTVIERMQETPVADPPPFLHQFRVHQPDLPGGTAKTEQADLHPDFQALSKGRPIPAGAFPAGAVGSPIHPWGRQSKRS